MNLGSYHRVGRIPFFLVLFIGVGVAIGSGLAAETPGALQLDLPAAIQAALEVDPQVLKAQSDLAIAQAQVAGEMARIAPGCSIGVRYGSEPRELGGVTETVRSTTVTFTISQERPGLLPRIIGQKEVSAVEQALWDLANAEEQLAQTRTDVTVATIQKYLAAMEADRLLELSRGALALAHEDERIARANLEVGTVTRIDVLKAESNRERSALDLARAEAERAAAHDALSIQVGRNIGESLSLVPPGTFTAASVSSVDELVARALSARIEARMARTSLRKAEAAWAKAKNASLPSLKLTADENKGDYSCAVTLDLTTGAIKWSAGGSLRHASTGPPAQEETDGLRLELEFVWNPFDGGARRAEVAAAEARLASARVSLAKTENEIRLDVRQRLSELNLARLQLEQARRELELAKQTRELAALRYREGIALFTELGEATQGLAKAEIGLVQSENALALAALRLERACGGGEIQLSA